MSNIKELLIDLEEVRAYRTLEFTPFDFGFGVLEKTSIDDESYHYEKAEREILNKITDMRVIETAIKDLEHKEKKARTSYRRKREDEDKLRCMKYVKIEEDIATWREKKKYISKRRKKRNNKRVIKQCRRLLNLYLFDMDELQDTWGLIM